ncbi:MAG: hypothetical protein HC915_16775 [Anaerolineae bacterium]|nr:hypothetical protein [Anaerolineae bacterium]
MGVGGALSHLMHATLPVHLVEVLSLGALLRDTLLTTGTWLTVGLVGAGAALWLISAPWRQARPAPGFFARLLHSDFGFGWVNAGLVAGSQRLAAVFALSQTGQLNWNLVGVAVAFAVVLLAVLLGGAA